MYRIEVLNDRDSWVEHSAPRHRSQAVKSSRDLQALEIEFRVKMGEDDITDQIEAEIEDQLEAEAAELAADMAEEQAHERQERHGWEQV